MAMNTIYNNGSSNVLTLEVRTIYDRNLLARLLPNLVYLPFGQSRPMPRQAGQTVQWRKFESLDIPSSVLTEGVTPSPRSLTMSQLTVTPEQWGDFVQISDILDMTAPDPVLLEAGQLLGEQAALLMDSKVRDVVAAGTNVQYAASRAGTASITSADKISAAEIRKAVRTMHVNNVPKLTSIMTPSTGVGSQPIPACYVAVISPQTLYDLKGDSAFVSVQAYSSTAVLPNEVGAIDEVRFVMSTNAKVKTGEGSGSIDVHCTIILGRDGFGVVSPVGVENIVKGFGAGDDPLNQRATSGWKAYFKAVRLNEACILRFEHAVTA
jgi:N4-gp56 family major capsid protein